jgi:hypothetical protein
MEKELETNAQFNTEIADMEVQISRTGIDISLAKRQWKVGKILSFDEWNNTRMSEKLNAATAGNTCVNDRELRSIDHRITVATGDGGEFVFEPAAYNKVWRGVVKLLPKLGIVIPGEVSNLVILKNIIGEFIKRTLSIVHDFRDPTDVVIITHFKEDTRIHAEMKPLGFRGILVFELPGLIAIRNTTNDAITLNELCLAIIVQTGINAKKKDEKDSIYFHAAKMRKSYDLKSSGELLSLIHTLN